MKRSRKFLNRGYSASSELGFLRKVPFQKELVFEHLYADHNFDRCYTGIAVTVCVHEGWKVIFIFENDLDQKIMTAPNPYHVNDVWTFSEPLGNFGGRMAWRHINSQHRVGSIRERSRINDSHDRELSSLLHPADSVSNGSFRNVEQFRDCPKRCSAVLL